MPQESKTPTGFLVPSNPLAGAVPLVEVRRNGRLDCIHAGWIAVADASGSLVFSLGDPTSVYPRSSAKPIQALPLVDSGAADALGLTDEELAVCTASHAAEDFHVEAVRRVLGKAGWDARALQCGAHAPLRDACLPAGVLDNNCSGKHAGMLAVCRHEGWDPAQYLSHEHPVQQAIKARFEALAEARLGWAVDGCGAPAWYMPLGTLAATFARLPQDPAGSRILGVMRSNPRMVAGTGRRDTLLMEATGGRIVSKGGAEGVTAGCAPERGIGWALKIADGNSRAVAPALIRLLERLELLSPEEAEAIAHLGRPELKNHAGAVVGEIVPADW